MVYILSTQRHLGHVRPVADIRLEKRSPVTRASGARSEIHIVVMQNVNRIVTEPEHGASFLPCIFLLSLGMTTQEPSTGHSRLG